MLDVTDMLKPILISLCTVGSTEITTSHRSFPYVRRFLCRRLYILSLKFLYDFVTIEVNTHRLNWSETWIIHDNLQCQFEVTQTKL